MTNLSFVASNKEFYTNSRLISVSELENVKSLEELLKKEDKKIQKNPQRIQEIKELIPKIQNCAQKIYSWKDFNGRFEVGYLKRFHLFILSILCPTNLAAEIAGTVNNYLQKHPLIQDKSEKITIKKDPQHDQLIPMHLTPSPMPLTPSPILDMLTTQDPSSNPPLFPDEPKKIKWWSSMIMRNKINRPT